MFSFRESSAVEQKLMATGRNRHCLVLFNKPNGVLCQFSDTQRRPTLANYINIPNFYPAGRLDFNTEGLVLLTNNGMMQARICEPRFGLQKNLSCSGRGISISDDNLKIEFNSGVKRRSIKSNFSQNSRNPFCMD